MGIRLRPTPLALARYPFRPRMHTLNISHFTVVSRKITPVGLLIRDKGTIFAVSNRVQLHTN